MTTAAPAAALESAARRALDAVRDPELDEPITDLGFVAALEVSGRGEVLAELRLPTYFCAPNFAYLMVADAHDALRAVPGVAGVRVRLLDHFASEEINAGVAAGGDFTGAFPGLAEGDLADLRRTFRRKAHTACQERVARQLLRGGAAHEALVALTLGAVRGRVPEADLERLRRRRADLGLPDGPDAALLLDDDGRPVPLEGLPARLRFARTTRISIEGNSGWCRGLLGTRYGGEPGVPGEQGAPGRSGAPTEPEEQGAPSGRGRGEEPR
ncbi:metal-sulfur cluster biosynthetic enzyme [Spinactinospora alkalitolerans]|uniref:Metal-sulfur cluster biosynthetic enzyme n=1 Tax=Spinactinospora alkalitolerans TaxID=687207 RepID=A0A852U9Z5_9ACTN|nr:iron-sulfur cluster assembly protein [Spinactinospora alkalitolerans]NYE50934.1 metal-sulfur cluster biosynthetic enzyme [Spinactinospora alkalitolerans]